MFNLLFVVELFYLVYWGAEGVSIHKENEVNTERKDRREIGDECLAKFGKKLYSGKIACYGKYDGAFRAYNARVNPHGNIKG